MPLDGELNSSESECKSSCSFLFSTFPCNTDILLGTLLFSMIVGCEEAATGLRLRKRAMKRNPDQWKKNQLASSVAAGQEHVNYRGRSVRAKAPKYPDCGKCKCHCQVVEVLLKMKTGVRIS